MATFSCILSAEKSKNSSYIFNFHKHFSRIFLRGHCRHVRRVLFMSMHPKYSLYIVHVVSLFKRNRKMIYFIFLILHLLILMSIISSTFFVYMNVFRLNVSQFVVYACRYMVILNVNGIFVNTCHFVSTIV